MWLPFGKTEKHKREWTRETTTKKREQFSCLKKWRK